MNICPKLRILITGSTGFIGKNLNEYLSSKACFELFTPKHGELELLDTQSVASYIADNRINRVVHCAKVGGSRKTAYDQGDVDVVYRNLRMFLNLAQALGRSTEMITLGSGAEYDYRHYIPKMKEEYFGKFVPDDPYGFSKYAISKLIEHSQNIINLRLFGVYGKYEDYELRFISNTILKNMLGLPVVINQNVNFDYLYVADLVRIIELFLSRKPRHKFYNTARGETIDLVTIARLVGKVTSCNSDIVVKNTGMNIEYSANNQRMLKEKRGIAFTEIERGIRELFSWYSSIIDTIDKERIKSDPYINACRINNS